MKKITFIAFVIMILCCVLLFSACEGLTEYLKTAVWPYSDDGEQEIKLNFVAFTTSGEAGGAFEWRFNFVSEEKNVTLYLFLEKKAEGEKFKCAFTDNQVNYAYLALGDDKYFINQTENTFKTPTEELSESEILLERMLDYGIVHLKNDQGIANWNFVSKNAESKITNYKGLEEDVITYIYESAEGEGGSKTQLRFDFKKALVPALVRMQYEIFDNNTLVETIIIHNVLETSSKIAADTFIAPTEAVE